MKIHRQVCIMGAAVILFIALTSNQGWSQALPDYALYAALLKTHVKNGVVSYRGFKKEEKKLAAYLDQLAKVDPIQLSRSEQMAFYINAYNAWTIKLILDHYPGVGSIKELGTLFQSPWKKKFVKLNGETISLDHIEHNILRPIFKDPRIHFAINCASKSCPPLLDEPYTGNELERQLDKVAKTFINDKRSNYVEGSNLYLSSIFKWFRKDFGEDLVGFVKSFAIGDLAKHLNSQSQLKIKYLKYDWSLNGN